MNLVQLLSIMILAISLVQGLRIWIKVRDLHLALVVFPLPLAALSHTLVVVARSPLLPISLSVNAAQLTYLAMVSTIFVATFIAGQLVVRHRVALSGARESESRYQALFDHSPVGIGVADMEGTLLAFNDAILYPGGFTREEIIKLGNNVGALYYDPAERTSVLAEFARDGRVRDREVRFKNKDGGWYVASLNLAPITFLGQPCILASVLDVTLRTQAEAALRSSEHFLRLSQEVGRIGSWEWNLTTNRVRWSPEMYRLHGVGHDEFDNTPEGYTKFVHVEDRPSIEQVIKDLLDGHAGKRIEYRITRGDGEQRFLAGTSAPVDGDDRTPVSVIGTVQDITDMKEVEAALRESQQRFRALADATDEGVLLHLDGVILEANNGAARLMGLAPDEMVGMNGLQYLSEETSERVRKSIARGEPFAGGGLMNRPDGTSFEVEFTGSPVEYQGGFARVLTFRDVTARNEAERSLRESRQRLRNFAAKLQDAREGERTSVSREIHDELGQSLTGLKMDFAWLTGRIAPHEGTRSRIASMNHLIDGMIETVRDLASRLRPGVLDDLGLVAAIDWQVRDFRKRSEITCEMRPPAETIDVDDATATAVFRILQEALTNVARHASASRVDVDLSATGDALLLTVRDDGTGVSDEALWATDSTGLMGMRERAGGLGGRVEVGPNEGGGTKIFLTLPR